MNITVEKLVGVEMARRACQFTMHSQAESRIGIDTLYACEHSPIRTQIFWVEMVGIPSFVSVHFVRHNVGVTHFVQTMRDDRGANDDVTRWTPVNHAMLANAQSLIAMARKRLCFKAHKKTRQAMEEIKAAMANGVDVALAHHMVRECEYRNDVCYEPKMCGMINDVIHYTDMGGK